MTKSGKWTLVAILSMGAALFLYRLPRVGLFYWDQAYYSVEARTADAILSAVPRVFRGDPINTIKEDIHKRSGGIFPTGVAKPSFMALLSVLSVVTRHRDFTIALLSVVCGWLSLLAVFWIGREVFDEETGLWSAGFLAFSAVAIYLVRGGFPNVVGIFFFLLGFLFLLRERPFLSGAVLGLAFTCHYGLFANFLLLVGPLLLWRFALPRGSAPKFSIVPWVAGLLLAPLAWETVYQGIAFGLRGRLSDVDFHTYFYYLKRQFIINSPAAAELKPAWQPLFFPRAFLLTQGAGFLGIIALASGSAVWAAFRRKLTWKEQLVFLQAVALPIFWACNPGVVVVRAAAFYIPFQCLMMGWMVARMNKPLLKAALFAVAILPAAPTMYRLLQYRSGYAQAAQFLASQKPGEVVAFENGPVWNFYLGPSWLYFRHGSAFSESDVKKSVLENRARYLVLDYGDDFSAVAGMEVPARREWVRKIQATHAPLAVAQNPMGCDELVTFDRGEWGWLKEHPEACAIRIYDLAAIYRR